MINERKTKILAKIADNRSEAEFLKTLFDAGADVAWLNTAHQGEAETIDVVKRIRSISTSVPIMIDTKGPEVRTRDVEQPIEIKKGDHIIFTGDVSQVGPNIVHVSYANFHNEIPVGEHILYDDASIEFTVIEKLPKGIKCEVGSKGLIKNKKSINVPNVHIDLPALSEKDKGFIHFCAKNNIDFIAHSFVRGKKDLMEIKKITDQYPDYEPKIISKLENRQGFDNVQEILKHSAGLMVARGDLGAEVPLEEMPFMQKGMVQASLEAGKYCIVATQVLESMIKNPRPTRAEVCDIGNAVLDGTGAMSMSGETAYGDYPFEATKTMGRVMAYTEKKRAELVHNATTPKNKSAQYKLATSLLKKAERAKARAIFAVGLPIETLRAFSQIRSNMLVIAACANEVDVRELGLAYGVRGVYIPEPTAGALARAAQGSFLAPKDKVLVLEPKKKSVVATVKAFQAIK
jgi:pyruvate kinase